MHMYIPHKYIDFLFSSGKRPDIFRTTEKKSWPVPCRWDCNYPKLKFKNRLQITK